MGEKSLSLEIAELVEQKISSSKKSITLKQTREAALKLSLKTNGKGRSISENKKERAVFAVDQATFNELKDNLKDEDIKRTVIQDISKTPDEMMGKASENKRMLKKFIGMIVRGAIIRTLSQALFQEGAKVLGGLSLAGGGAQAIAEPSQENFYIALEPYKYLTENQIELFQNYLPSNDIAIGGEVAQEIAANSVLDGDMGIDSESSVGIIGAILDFIFGN